MKQTLWNIRERVYNFFHYRKTLKKNIKAVLSCRGNHNIFIETGTHKGNMINGVKGYFRKIYSFELGRDLWFSSFKRFRYNHSIKIIWGDSAEELPKILEVIKEPCLFWLDAHYSGGETARADEDTVIEKELAVVLKHPYNHTILIDDARLFNGRDGYPTRAKLEEIVRNSKYTLELKDDIFRLTFNPKSVY